MSFKNQHGNPVALYIAPNCGLEISHDSSSQSAEFGSEYTLNNPEDFPLKKTPKVVKGWLSPLHKTTLPDDKREKAAVPKEAEQYCFVYPPVGLADHIDWQKVHSREPKNSDTNKNMWALPYIASFGGYAYFDGDDNLLCINAITLKETKHILNFEGPFVATKDAYREINALNRYQSLYLDVFGEVGFIGSAWMDPGENRYIDNTVEGQSEVKNSHGGFLYFRNDGTAVIFFVDTLSMNTPHSGIGSSIRDAFTLCKEELKHDSLSTTCPSGDPSYDKIRSAIQHGSKEDILLLLKGKSHELKRQDCFGWTPLHHACCYRSQDDEIITFLTNSCPEAVYITNNNDLCPIHLACQNNPSLKVITILLDCDQNKRTIYMKSKHHKLLPLHFACRNSETSMEVIKSLIFADHKNTTSFEKGALGATSLHLAISGNHNHEVISLLYKTASNRSKKTNLLYQNANGMVPLHLACLKSSSVDIVSLLLNADKEDVAYNEHGIKCKEFGLSECTVMHIALSHSSAEVINLLLLHAVKRRCMPIETKVDLFKVREKGSGMLPIHMACKRKDLEPEIFSTLLRLKRDSVFCQDDKGNTPLHYICENPKADHRVIKMLLESEEIARENQTKKEIYDPAAKTLNKKDESPLCLAAKAAADGANILLRPENIFLGEMGPDQKDGILQLALKCPDVKKNIVKNLAQRPYFIFIMLELVSNIISTIVYFQASMHALHKDSPISIIEIIILLVCISVFVVRESIELTWSDRAIDYIANRWNWIEISSIVSLLSATIHMINLRIYDDLTPNRYLFIWSGVVLLLQFIFILRSTFLPFARFVAGLLEIAYTLVPFFVVSLMILIGFSYSFYMSGGREDECPSFGGCLLWTIGGFFYGVDEFTTPYIDVIFGVFAVVVL